jgi:hypothetical protein
MCNPVAQVNLFDDLAVVTTFFPTSENMFLTLECLDCSRYRQLAALVDNIGVGVPVFALPQVRRMMIK